MWHNTFRNAVGVKCSDSRGALLSSRCRPSHTLSCPHNTSLRQMEERYTIYKLLK